MANKKKYMVAHKQSKQSNHHILPKSRGGKSNLENIVQLDIKAHRQYHTLFGNKTPEEIISYLVTDYWNNQWSYVANAHKDYINRTLDKYFK